MRKSIHLAARMARLTFATLGVLTLALAGLAVPAQAAGDPNCPTGQTCPTVVSVPTTGLYGVEARTVAALMAAHPTPGLAPVPIDLRQLYDRAYRRVMDATDVYDAPNGHVIGHIDAGFNFVNAGTVQEGWVEIRPGQWLPEKILGPVNKAVSKYSGVALPDGLPALQFGWVLLDTKPSPTPGAQPITGTTAIKRYTLVNLFASEDVDGWTWFLVGPGQWIVQTRIAVPHPVAIPAGVTGKWVAVDLYEQTLIAYQDNKAVFATLISSGLEKWPTQEGTFQIYDRHQLIKMSGMGGQPDFYYLPEVPFVMYFNQAEQALHGAYWHDGFGFRHSHGCVNMSITDAQWIFNWTQDTPTATVYVYHSGDYKHGAPR
ncbi:MAG: L,D-transpeptidase [Aggregatilineales bacterium]